MGTRTALAALLAPVFLLTACDGGTSIADPPVSPPSSTSSAPPPPQRESPEHFVTRWFNVGTRMQNSGETREYRAMQERCRACLAVANHIEKAYAAGGFFHTRGVRSLNVTVRRRLGGRIVLDVRVDLFPTTYKNSSEGAVQSFHGGPAHFQVRLKPASGTWIVTGFVQVAT